jgi:hypothetical protein
MAVQEIGVPTGFEADVESIGKVDGLKKIEQGSRKVIPYFDEVRTFFFVKLLFNVYANKNIKYTYINIYELYGKKR